MKRNVFTRDPLWQTPITSESPNNLHQWRLGIFGRLISPAKAYNQQASITKCFGLHRRMVFQMMLCVVLDLVLCYNLYLGTTPTQDASHRQDYCMISTEPLLILLFIGYKMFICKSYFVGDKSNLYLLLASFFKLESNTTIDNIVIKSNRLIKRGCCPLENPPWRGRPGVSVIRWTMKCFYERWRYVLVKIWHEHVLKYANIYEKMCVGRYLYF